MAVDFQTLLWLAIVVGAVFGSFANVVIYRVPEALMAAWRAAISRDGAEDADDEDSDEYSLAIRAISTPRSHCPSCQKTVAFYDNIPVLSWFILRGRCRNCKASIAFQYPVIELVCALAFAGMMVLFQDNLVLAVVASALFWVLLVLGMIDWRTGLLPDLLTMPLLWAGLLVSANNIVELSLVDSLKGAIWGYCGLRFLAIAYKLIRGRQGIGGGDFKLAGAIGAWIGALQLPLMMFCACVFAIVQAALLALSSASNTSDENTDNKVDHQKPEDDLGIPEQGGQVIYFGPALATAAFIVWIDQVAGFEWFTRVTQQISTILY